MAHNLYSGFAIQNTFMSTVVLINEVSEVLQRHYLLTLLVAGGCFYPPLGFFLNISQTVWARILKFSDFS